MRAFFRTMWLFAGLVAAVSCTGKTDEPAATKTDDGSTAKKDDDLDVVEGVPMYLVDGKFLEALGTVESPVFDAGKASGAAGAAALGAPARAAATARVFVAAARASLQATFAGGALDYKLSKRNPTRLLAIGSAAAPRFLRLSLGGGAFKYHAQLFEPKAPPLGAADGGFAETLSAEWTPGADGKTANVRLDLATAGLGAVTHVTIAYDSAGDSVDVAFGDLPYAEDAPAKTLVRLTGLSSTSFTRISGGFLWRGVAKTPPSAPPYLAPGNGSLAVFLAAGDKDSGLFAEVLATDAAPRTLDLSAVDVASLTGRTYRDGLDAFLARTLRDPAIDAGCATAGTTLKSAFKPETTPAAVAAVATDLCAGGSATDAEVVAAVAASCGAGVPVAIVPPGQSAPGIALCDAAADAAALGAAGEPLVFRVSDAARTLVAAKDDANAAKLAAALRVASAVSLAELAVDCWGPVIVLTAADAAKAEPATAPR